MRPARTTEKPYREKTNKKICVEDRFGLITRAPAFPKLQRPLWLRLHLNCAVEGGWSPGAEVNRSHLTQNE